MIRLCCWMASLVLVLFGTVLLVGGFKAFNGALVFDGICVLIVSLIWCVLPDIFRD